MKIPLEIKSGKFEQRDLDRIRFFEVDSAFENYILKARNEVSSSSKPSQAYLIARSYAERVILAYQLSESWINSISTFIMHNKFPSPGKGYGMSGFGLTIQSNLKDKRPINFTLTVSQRTSFDEFYKWIWRNKSIIERHLKHLPPKKPLQKGSIDMQVEIFRLSTLGYKPKQIEKELLKNFKNKQELVPSSKKISELSKFLKRKYQPNHTLVSL